MGMGAPHKRDEYWRYTDPSALTAVPTAPAALFTNDEAPMFDGIDRVRVVFVDGMFMTRTQSDDLITGWRQRLKHWRTL